MGIKQSTAAVHSSNEKDYERAIENFYSALSPITVEERRMQKRSILEATPNKYTRYELSKESYYD